jgi:O-antigen/teichoic acid export membrane protein
MSRFPGPSSELSIVALARSFSLSLVKTAVSLLANIMFVLMTARAFSHEQVAVLAVAGIATMLMDACKGLGLGSLLLRQLPRLSEDDPAAGALIRSHMLYSLLPPAALAGAGFLLPAPLSRYFFGSDDYVTAIRLSMVLGLFTVLTNTNLLVFQARQQFGRLAGMTIASAGLQRIAPCLMLLAGTPSLDVFLTWAAAGAAAGFVISCIPLSVTLFTAGARPLCPPSDFWPQSRHFYYSSLLRYTTTQIDQLFVAALFPPATLAVYYMLRRLYSIGVVLIGSLMDALAPELSRQAGSDLPAARDRLGGWLRVMLYTGTIVAAVLAGHGGPLIDLLLGPGYGEDTFLIALFSVSAVTYFLHGFVQMDVTLFQDPKRSFRLAAATAAANWLAGPLTTVWFGVHSIPLAMIAGHLLGLAAVGRGGPGRLWQPAQMLVSLGAITLAAAVSMAAPHVAGAHSGWARWVAVNLVVAGFSLTQYSNWQVGKSWRLLAAPVS